MSWVDDEGISGWAMDEDGVYDSDSEVDEWEDKDHNVTLIADLDTKHIENIIRGLSSDKDYWGQRHKLRRLQLELERRKIDGRR